MRKLLYATVAAVLFAPLALAGENIAPPGGYYAPMEQRQSKASLNRYAGGALSVESPTGSTGSTTTDRVEFGFLSNFVSVCVQGGIAAATVVYIRFEFDASTDNWADRLATTSALYIAGSEGTTGLGGPAMVMSGGGDGTNARCLNLPVRARGVTIHNVASATSTLEVNAW